MYCLLHLRCDAVRYLPKLHGALMTPLHSIPLASQGNARLVAQGASIQRLAGQSTARSQERDQFRHYGWLLASCWQACAIWEASWPSRRDTPMSHGGLTRVSCTYRLAVQALTHLFALTRHFTTQCMLK